MRTNVRSTVVHPIVLRYPSAWCAPRNPHAPAATRRAEELLRRAGVIHDAAGERLFERLDVPDYSGLPFPHAGREELTNVAVFLTLWIFYDDVVEERGESALASVERALRGEAAPAARREPCHRAFLELGRRFRAVMSPVWMERHAARYMEWLRSVGEETKLARRLRETGRSPHAREFLPVRRVSVGALPVLCWVEYVTGVEVPPAVLADDRVRRIELCAAEAIASVNEIAGWWKDRESRWPNLVDCIAAEEGLSMPRAFARAAAKHNACVDEMRRAMDDLLADPALGPFLADWTRAVGQITLGFARWHQRAPRYRTKHDLGDGQEVTMEIALSPSRATAPLAA